MKVAWITIPALVALLFAYLHRTGAQHNSDKSASGSMGLLGGYSTSDGLENDAQVKEAANFAVNEIQKGLKLEKIVSVQTQVVAGTNYKLVLQTSSGIFDVTVFKGLGDGPFKLSSYKRAEGSESGQGMLGGKKEVSADHKDVQAAANAVVKELSSRSNSLDDMKLKKVVKAHSKVHGQGTEYSLLLSVSQGSKPDANYQANVTRTLDDKYEFGNITPA